MATPLNTNGRSPRGSSSLGSFFTICTYGLHALDLVPNEAVTTASGFNGFVGCIFGTSIAGTGLGAIADKIGWNGVFSVMAVCCILTLFLSSLTLKGKATSL